MDDGPHLQSPKDATQAGVPRVLRMKRRQLSLLTGKPVVWPSKTVNLYCAKCKRFASVKVFKVDDGFKGKCPFYQRQIFNTKI
jgi:hypothetical protein